MTELIPLDQLGVSALLLAPIIIAVVQMAKAVGLRGRRRQATFAVLAGQVLALGHWAVAWRHDANTCYYAVLVGIIASAAAMGLWAAALKGPLGKPPTDGPTT